MNRAEIIKAGEELAAWLDNDKNNPHVITKVQAKYDAELIRSIIALVPKDGLNHRELMAVEFGYRQCEKGMNLEAAFDKFKAMLKAAKEK